jgi:hypothetical protein
MGDSMSTIINATTTNGVVIQPDNSGSLALQTNNGTAALTIDTSQNLQFNSGYGSVATAYGCRAWVNFNGTGTVAIRASGNVTSITDGGTGMYTVNFTTAMPDANYACVFGIKSGNTTNPNGAAFNTTLLQTTDVAFGTFEGANSNQDYSIVTLAIFR